MPDATGADLPPEMLSRILYYLTPPDTCKNRASHSFELSWKKYLRLKSGLATPSLVCKHWSEAIRPLLFSRLGLRSAEDVRMLRNVIDSPRFRTSSLSGAIQRVSIQQEAAQTKPAWLHHVHWLTSRLQETLFHCYITSPTDGSHSMIGHRDLFRSLPRVPPLYSLRLTGLVLRKLQFASATEAALLIDGFPFLQRLACYQLTFLDPSPVVQSRRSSRRPSSSLVQCQVYQCEAIPLSAKAALASDILSIATRVGLDFHTWDAVLHALLALAPGTFQAVRVEIRQPEHSSLKVPRVILGPSTDDIFSLRGSYIDAYIGVRQENAGQGVGPPSAFIDRIYLCLSFSDAQAIESLRFDDLQTIVDAPLFDGLRFPSDTLDGPRCKTLKAILRSVLQGTQLDWALKSDKLKFRFPGPQGGRVLNSQDIRSLQASLEHTIDDVTITLDAAEQVEWIIRDGQGKGDEYLEELVAARARGPSADASSGTVAGPSAPKEA
ncbi:uncharacterized protein PHACADRAFT_206170 [Phanerochaete carnosa HHB-10118-sp]|uniref:F-box domain-containing protein n=1 Tax=Phanerochaete carnosa (strain HHB-10118-sp) TaxID=650164 RepID=K5WKM2_PHACS|nr:uncharacterized protein PHACADRAFT_206170 [Phanerochaete carnosa HHB-10118-sp]EKM59955.1 hypothetical protein PHACADRAFT_206170 [Phanerochaete carnosa HHB-10118-sp]